MKIRNYEVDEDLFVLKDGERICQCDEPNWHAAYTGSEPVHGFNSSHQSMVCLNCWEE